ncbi:MAG: copper homeostasis protein CutC [Lacrimispora sp.]|uniref:copper homeostasis protein CutC n=1 Tax=Lacrimispora sp. TaxID=2719234 RepID=UPI0039E3E5CD
MGNYILEVCVDSVESAKAAVRGGADRLELCANLVIGGTTPGISQFKQVRKACDVPINVLVRPRYGDFLYTDHEFQMIMEDVEMFRKLGADGFVVGCLRPDGNLDTDRMKALREKAGKGRMTLHRAFDVCRDPYRSLKEVKEIGVDTILTSGQQDTCMKGKALLGELIREAGDETDILVGSGVNAEAIACLMEEIDARCFHMSGKVIADSGMIYRKEDVNMGIPGIGEYDIFRTDENLVSQAKKLLEAKTCLHKSIKTG